MKTIKFVSSEPKRTKKKKKKVIIPKKSSGSWLYKMAAFTGVFCAAFFSFIIFNSQLDDGQNIAKAEVQKNSEVFNNDISKFLQWMDIIRQNSWNNRPLFQPIVLYNFLNPEDLRGLNYPVRGGYLPLAKPSYMPNAHRGYRNGIHEGVDFTAVEGRRIYSAWWGKIVRIDKNFQEVSYQKYQEMIRRAFQASTTPSDVLDSVRGRQIWIDHGNGVVTRYCHLSSVSPNLVLGQVVNQGDYIGLAGKSGLKWAGFGAHLHFEIRIGDKYLGQAESYQIVKELYSKAFAVL